MSKIGPLFKKEKLVKHETLPNFTTFFQGIVNHLTKQIVYSFIHINKNKKNKNSTIPLKIVIKISLNFKLQLRDVTLSVIITFLT